MTVNIKTEDLLASLKTCMVSKALPSNTALMPSLLVNDYHKEKKILSTLQEELSNCCSFAFSVAFINNEGLAAIKLQLAALAEKGICGRILTTNYLNFTQPSALTELLQFPNIQIRAYTKGGFHPKGYIFNHIGYTSIIIGSANLTAAALSMNQEWSMHFLSLTDGQIVSTIQEEFERIWQDATIVDSNWIQLYADKYEQKKIAYQLVQKELAKLSNSTQLIAAETSAEYKKNDDLEIVPNKMQEEAMTALAELRSRNENRALLIAATGTGKTYLSIFDVEQQKPRKVLYIAHREMILKKSEKSFTTILPNINTGFLTGTSKNINADYLFASVFTLAKDEILQKFTKDEFDYIIIDEVHHAGAKSYEKIINYFSPKFLLGLTATPERSDGYDIFKLFHNNIPYEIRLQKAMEADLLCPFHYYGITDITVNGEEINDKSDFTKLVSEERIRHIEKAIKLYRNYTYPVKGLIFCSRIDEAKALSEQLNHDGFYTKYLTGENSDAERESVVEELESNSNPLQYIITVDIFNEGVDIPSVNQVVMLRPTQSAIIFVQQLGRGLRKDPEKSYVSVIDFIGNYENNFFIPIALYGDNSYNKDNLRKTLGTGSAGLPGTSTVQISEVARKKIFESISNTNFNTLKLLKGEYEKLSMRLGHTPNMMDFVNHGFIDPFLFINYKGSYYAFKCLMAKKEPTISYKHICSLQFISIEFARGIRLHEVLLLQLLLNRTEITLSFFRSELKKYGVSLHRDDIQGLCRTLSPNYYRENDKSKYGNISYIEYDENSNVIIKSASFKSLLQNNIYRKEIEDVLQYAINKATLKGNEKYHSNNLVLYRKYTRKDVFKLLNFDKDQNPQNVGGYIIQEVNGQKKCPVFVTYKKAEETSSSTKYEDYFIDNVRFNWMSKNKRYIKSPDVKDILEQETNKIQIPLFIKKDDNEGADFYYLGMMHVDPTSAKQEKISDDNGNLLPVVNLQYDLQPPLTQNMFNYLQA